MTAPRARCEACGVTLPVNAVRCPTCGHQQGEPITVEVGRRGGRDPRSGGRSRRDLIVLAVVVAMVLGALVFAGRDSEKPAVQAATTTTTSTTSRRTTSSPTTTTEPTATTTTLPALQLGERSGIKLLVTTEADFVSLIDLDTGETSRLNIPAFRSYLPRADGVVIVNRNGGATFFREPYDAPGVDLGFADGVYASTFDDRVWLTRYLEFSVTISEVDETGAITAGPFTIPPAQVVGAGTAGVVVSTHGSIYVVDRLGSARRVASGDAIAAVGDSVFAAQCDDQLRCGSVLIDLSTGGVQTLEGLGDQFGFGISPVISPDGRTAAVLVFRETQPTRLILVDLATANITELVHAVVGFSPMAPSFSRNSDWLFFSTGLETTVYRLRTGEKRTLTISGSPISAIAAV